MRALAPAALAAAAALAGPALAAPEEFIVDRGHTFPTFEVLHLGISTQRGRFERTTGRIVLDREARTGTLTIEIDTRSVSTGNPLLDEALRGEDFFAVDKHPKMVFEAGRMEFEKGEPRRAQGELTLLGVRRPVAISIERFGCTRRPFFVRTTCGADVVATLSRSAFGMTSYPAFIGDEVKVVIQIEAVKTEPAVEPPPAGG